MLQRIALGLEYSGYGYHGWQKQTNYKTVQQTVEHALAQFLNQSVNIICAGRTDAKVHAVGQVVHFDTNVIRSDIAWLFGLNRYLPNDIKVFFAQAVPPDFDARKSALARRYCYVIYNSQTRPAILANQLSWYYKKIAVAAMDLAAKQLLGEHDFSSFRGSECQSLSPVRSIYQINVSQTAELIIIDIIANSFLQHMVRNIVGVLLEIGYGNQKPSWITDVLHAKDRRVAASTAKASGLYLIGVEYPQEFGLSTINSMPWFFKNMGITI